MELVIIIDTNRDGQSMEHFPPDYVYDIDDHWVRVRPSLVSAACAVYNAQSVVAIALRDQEHGTSNRYGGV